MMFDFAAGVILVTMALVLVSACRGPTVYDRILAVNAFGSLTVVFLAVYGFISRRPEFLDVAMVYALINFIGTIAVTKYVRFSHMGHPLGDDDREDV